MANLLEQMRRARESVVALDDRLSITIRRPTDMDALGMVYGTTQAALRGVLPFVVGWKGFTELDLVSSGSSEPVAFDGALFAEWAEDHPEHWTSIVNAVIEAYQAHKQKADEAGKG